jgi:hypothetical protein
MSERTDTERLDWLSADVEGPPRISTIANEWWRGPESMTVRQAIDAAIDAEEDEIGEWNGTPDDE